MTHSRSTSYIAILVAAVLFGTTGTSRALAGVEASASAVGAARIICGGLILLAIALLRRGPRTELTRLHSFGAGAPAKFWLVVTIGIASVFAYQPLFFYGVEVNGVGVGTLCTLAAAPVTAGTIEWIMYRTFPGRRWVQATVLAIVGVTFLSGVIHLAPDTGATTAGHASLSLLGLAASIAAGASYSTLALANGYLLRRGMSTTGVLALLFGASGIAALPLLLTQNPRWVLTPSGLTLFLWLGIITVVITYTLFSYSLKELPASTVATLTILEPVTATILGVALLDEELTWQSGLGIIFILLGLLSLIHRQRLPKTPQDKS